jgi:hypothetical protein
MAASKLRLERLVEEVVMVTAEEDEKLGALDQPHDRPFSLGGMVMRQYRRDLPDVQPSLPLSAQGRRPTRRSWGS